MSELTIEVTKRESRGKNANRRLRAEGLIPAVVYGGKLESTPIQVDRKKVRELLRSGGGENSVFLLKLSGTGKSRHAMIRDLMLDPISRQITHLDFMRVDMTEKIRVRVPIELEGTAEGVKTEGGMLDFVNRDVEVECLPGDIPDSFILDVTELSIGDHAEAGDLTYPSGVELIDDASRVIVSVSHARVAEVEEEAEDEGLIEAAPVEPELIGKGKEEEEGED